MAAAIIDVSDLDGTPSSKRAGPLGQALASFLDRTWAVETGQRHDPMVDFRFDLGLFPYEGELYGATHTERPHFHERWMREADVDDFSYWPAAVPASVGADRWAHRRDVWQALCTVDGTPVSPVFCGMVVHCVPPWSERLEPEAALASLPTTEERAQQAARHAVLERWMAEHCPPPPGKKRPSAAARRTAEQKAQIWLETPDGEAAIAAEARAILPRLRTPLTLRDLTGGRSSA
jgi:hypothetical protein